MAGTPEVRTLLRQLEADLTDQKLSSQQKQSLLEKLKVLGRNPANSEPIFASDGFTTLMRYAFDGEPDAVSREALRCMANAMLLNEGTRQIFLDAGSDVKAAERLKVDNRDDEFLASRVLFFSTYTAKVDVHTLLSDHELANSVHKNLVRHAEHCRADGANSSFTPLERMAMDETLKLIPNLVYYSSEASSALQGCIEPICSILMTTVLPTPALSPPITNLINALMNLDLPASDTSPALNSALFPLAAEASLVDRLISILDTTASSSTDRSLDTSLPPLVNLIRKTYIVAPNAVQQHMRSTLLPDSTARDKPLGQDSKLPSRLLRLSISPLHPLLRDSISTLLFELSDKDASKFVEHIGYGHAAGFLASNGIPMPESMNGGSAAAGKGSNAGEEVNPVTGQRRAAEPVDAGPEMTDEEKEREAERLFVLFERLRATGVVDVKNPVQQAIDEGRFEELPD